MLKMGNKGSLALLCAGLLALAAHAQGRLVVTPGQAVGTAAGTGVAGFGGDGAAATAAALASPGAVAFDGAGNLYVADTRNHVIREVVKSSGNIVTVAGTGVAGFAGDGGAATSALLDTPTGVAVDASGALYIADAHNHRVRRVAAGTITTVAGTGVAGSAGDGGAATAAQLASPQGVAVDASGTLYVADTGNHRVRKVASGTISTFAGTGDQGYTGDGAAATLATLDAPTSVAVDAAGNVYVADRHNHRIRVVNSGGTISTLAGSGTPNFAGGFAGDGASATSAVLSRPSGVAVDAAGNVYVVDTNNQRIRTVTSGVVTTAVGSGDQGFAGNGVATYAALLSAPRAVAVDASGNLAIADTNNQRVRGIADAAIPFGSAAVGVASATQTVTLANSGTASLTVSSAALTGPFALASSGTCPAVPITLAAGASCTEMLTFTPTATGAAAGTIAFAGAGATPQTLLLSGTGAQAASAVALASNTAAPFVNQSVTFTASVKPAGVGTATGTVSFFANGAAIGTAQTLSNGSASVTTSFATAGTYAITATYAGSNNFGGNTSAALAQPVGDFSFTITNDPGQSGSVTSVPGAAVAYKFQVAPVNGPFSFPVTLSATGLPPGATVVFSPSTVTLGASAVPVTMTIQTSATVAALHGAVRNSPLVALLLLPVAATYRRRRDWARRTLLLGCGVLSLAAMAGLSGCGSNSGFFGTGQHTYTINVIGTAAGAQGSTLQRVTTVQLTLQ